MAIDRESPKQESVMDVTEEQIARVYAKAFLGAISQSPKAGELVGEVESFVGDVLAKYPKFEETLYSEFVDEEEKLKLLDRVLGGRASVEVLNYLKVLLMRGRLALVRPIARILKKLYAEQSGRVDVEVCTAHALDEALQAEVLTQLRSKLGAEPVVRVVVDPSLIAGIVVRVGDKVYDGSVKTRFELIRKSMIDRATDAIEAQPGRFVVAGT